RLAVWTNVHRSVRLLNRVHRVHGLNLNVRAIVLAQNGTPQQRFHLIAGLIAEHLYVRPERPVKEELCERVVPTRESDRRKYVVHIGGLKERQRWQQGRVAFTSIEENRGLRLRHRNEFDRTLYAAAWPGEKFFR